jgi:DNA transformation protein
MADPHRFDDLFREFGPVALRRFFGGEGVFAGETMIGMVFDDVIYLKTDAETRKPFLAERCKPFTFEKGGETIGTGWFAAPERLYDDPEEFAQWARAALKVAASSPTARKKAARKRS